MVLKPCFLHTDPRNHEKISPGVRGKAGFTHDRGKLNPDVSGKRFSAHVAEERRPLAREEGIRGREERPSLEEKGCLSGEKTTIFHKKTGRATAPDLLSSDYRGETSCPAFRRYRYKFHSAGH